MTRRYWLSFVDETGFLGVAIVDVTDQDIARLGPEIASIIRMRRAEVGTAASDAPVAPDALWAATALRVAAEQGCNPGGQVGFADITEVQELASAGLQAFRLYQEDELLALGVIKAEPSPAADGEEDS